MSDLNIPHTEHVIHIVSVRKEEAIKISINIAG